MAITRIRGGQIQDRTIDGIKILQGVLLNEHVADNAAIAESKLDIDWSNHYQSALETKKVVDFVQVNGTDADGVSVVDLTAAGIILATQAQATSNGSEEGVIIDSEKNKAIVRDAVTGDPILDANGQEVYGRVTFDSTNNVYDLGFFSYDASANAGAGAEVAFTMPAGQKINFQYAQRFNLATVSELFAANEKFVDGAADVTAYLNIEQLAKDLYGATYSLDRDGNANLAKSLAQQISEEVTRATTAEQTLQTNIDNEATARQNADQAIKDALASNATGQGASTVGIEDAGNKFTATTVEGAFAEIEGRVANLETNGGAEVTATHTRSADTTNGVYTADSFSTLEDRLENIEGVVDSNVKALQDADQAAKNDLASNTNGKGASLVGIEDAGSLITATTVEGALQEIVTNLNTEITNRTDADTQAAADLASTATGKGAGLVGVDAAAGLTGSTVEAVLENLNSRMTSQESGGGAEVTDTHTRDAASANNYFAAKTGADAFASLEARIVDVETIADAQFKSADDVKAEVTTARGSAVSLDARLDIAINEDGTLKVGTQIHTHKKYITTIASTTSTVAMPVGETFVSDGTLDVYVNGILQANGTNFTEVVDGSNNGISIDFGSDSLLVGDVVVIKYIKYNAQ